MLFKPRHNLYSGIALLFGCFILFDSGMALAENKDVNNGETVSNLTLSPTEQFDLLNVNDGGIADNTTVNNGGTANINNGGTANNTTINNGGVVNVMAQGTANTVTVNYGGLVVATSNDATINGATVNDGGNFEFSTDATVTGLVVEGVSGSISGKNANNILVNKSSSLTVTSGGTANKIKVNGGEIVLDANSAADTITIENNGSIEAVGTGTTVKNVTVKEDGKFEFSTDVTVNNLKNSSGASLGSIQDKQAQNFILNEGSSLIVNDGGTADNTAVRGGNLDITGGTASNTTVAGGSVDISGTGKADIITVTGSGSIRANDNAIVNNTTLNGNSSEQPISFDLSGSATANTSILNAHSEMNVFDNANANNTTVNDTASLTLNGGTATNTIVESGGLISADNNATITNATLKTGGTFDLSTNVTVSGLTNERGSSLGTIQDKTAQNFYITDGSNLTVKSNGKALNTTVLNGGNIVAIETGAVIDGLTVVNGGTFDLSTAATVTNMTNGSSSSGRIENNIAENIKVTEGSTLSAVNGGTIQNAGASGGTIIVENGSADMIAVGDGGLIQATTNQANLTNIHISNSGRFDFSTEATVSAEYGDSDPQLILIQNKKALDFAIEDDSRLSVDSNGQAVNITVAGGELVVNSGGTSSNALVSSGMMTVDGGVAETTTVKNSGVLNVDNNASVTNTKILTGGTVNLTHQSRAEGVVLSDGTLNIGEDSLANNATVNGGLLNVVGGTAENATINNGGTAKIAAGTLKGATVTNGGVLTTSTGATVNNLAAKENSIINLASGTTLGGDFELDTSANLRGSSFDFKSIIGASNDTVTTLTLDHGVHNVFGTDLVNKNTATDKTLNLKNGSYMISDSGAAGTVNIGGWNNINLSNASARLDSDLIMNGTEKNFTVLAGSNLDVSGTLENVLNVSLSGNLINSGTIDSTLQGDSYNDSLTINGNYTGANAARMILNINPRENTADKLIVNGDVFGKTEILFKSSSPRVPANNILFAEATGTAQADAFHIWRVLGSPFSWDTLFENNKWYGYVTDGNSPTIVPETAAYYGLIDNTFMQTESLGANLRKNIAENELRKVPCRVPDNLKYTNRICRGNRPIFTGWMAPVYSTGSVKSPYNYTASITGMDGGLDLIGNGFAKFGLLGSYRNGLYKYEHSGTTYTLRDTEAETTINSYLAGAYIRMDASAWSVLAAAYGGMLNADISTDDGVSADTSGSTFGATLDVSYIYQNINGIRIEPGVRISYTSVKLDEVEDNAGKVQEFDNASRTEAEAGIKIAKRWDFNDARAEIYVRPSVVHLVNDSSAFELVEERLLDLTEDKTFVRLEAGVSFDMTNNFSAALSGAYSFGSDYDNATAGFNLIYNF